MNMKVKVKRIFFLVLNWTFLILYALLIAWYKERCAFFRNQTSYTLESQSLDLLHFTNPMKYQHAWYVLATYWQPYHKNLLVKIKRKLNLAWELGLVCIKWKNLKNFLISEIERWGFRTRNLKKYRFFWMLKKNVHFGK